MINIKKYSELVGFVSGLVSLGLGIFTFITQLLDKRYAILLFLIGLFFVLQRFFTTIITEKKEVLNFTTEKYSSTAIRWAKFGKLASHIIWIYPIFLIYLFFSSFNTRCNSDSKVGILVTSFSTISDDDFSYKLFHILEDKFQSTDSISIVKADKFINPSGNKYIDTFKRLSNENCISKGLLVFGKRSEQSKLFDCNIYVHNLPNISTDTIRAKRSDILFLQNPDVLNFSIDEQAAKISEFIQGLLYLNGENQELARGCFQRASNISGVKNNRFISHCMFFIGNSFAKQHNYSEAIKFYKNGLNLDSINAYMHFNLGTVLLLSKDSASAFTEYTFANRINPYFVNPIQNYIHKKTLPEPIIVSPSPAIENSAAEKEGKEEEEEISNANTENKEVKDDTVTFKMFYCNSKIGIKDSKGKTILDCKFDYAGQPFNYKDHNYFIVGISNKFGAYNLKGQKIVPVIHQSDYRVREFLKLAIDLAPESLTPIKE